MKEIEESFAVMLADARHAFDLAVSARIAGADPATVVDDLAATESRTDRTEREIRRRIVVYASVHGVGDLAACLMYFSIAKDAERIADLSKNLLEIAEEAGPVPPGPVRDEMVELASQASPLISEAGRVVQESDRDAAVDVIERARAVRDVCDNRVREMLRSEHQSAADAISYRHISRICANLSNIASAAVVPLDQLDYPEDREDMP